MALSDYEKEILEQMESQLREGDPHVHVPRTTLPLIPLGAPNSPRAT